MTNLEQLATEVDSVAETVDGALHSGHVDTLIRAAKALKDLDKLRIAASNIALRLLRTDIPKSDHIIDDLEAFRTAVVAVSPNTLTTESEVLKTPIEVDRTHMEGIPCGNRRSNLSVSESLAFVTCTNCLRAHVDNLNRDLHRTTNRADKLKNDLDAAINRAEHAESVESRFDVRDRDTVIAMLKAEQESLERELKDICDFYRADPNGVGLLDRLAARLAVKKGTHESFTDRCPACARKEGAVNHVPGHIFVGWGQGWQRCVWCHGTEKVTRALPKRTP